ncbi:MAG: malic enzyme-like NAD(P)-binding protein [Deltaproteobacteria bacterium]
MFFVAAKTLAQEVSADDLKQGSVYPPLGKIRQVAAAVATAVAEVAYQNDLATKPRPDDILAAIKAQMYEPQYHSYV